VIADPQASEAELRALLTELRDHVPDDSQVTIRRCPNLDQPIVELEYSHPPVPGLIRLTSPIDADRGLWCEPIYGSPVHDIDSLVNALWQLHGQPIAKGHFSCDRQTKCWRPFDADELGKIEAALGEEDEEA
jgi:hypothetical protein